MMLELVNIKKTFNPGTVNEKRALNGISLSVDKGDFITIIGSNGAGKSTLFNAICGSFLIDEGKILLDGKDITKMPDYKRAFDIGRLFQDPMKGTAPNMTIEENMSLAYCRKAQKSFFAVNKRDTEYFRELLSQLDLGLEDRMKTKIGLLSGGQRQALTLLMASLKRPKLLLLDEHTAALDPTTAAKVLELSDKIVEENGLTAMMITHNMTDAIRHGNRLIMMNEGRIILDIAGEEKKKLTKRDLLERFAALAGVQEETDAVLLS